MLPAFSFSSILKTKTRSAISRLDLASVFVFLNIQFTKTNFNSHSLFLREPLHNTPTLYYNVYILPRIFFYKKTDTLASVFSPLLRNFFLSKIFVQLRHKPIILRVIGKATFIRTPAVPVLQAHQFYLSRLSQLCLHYRLSLLLLSTSKL